MEPEQSAHLPAHERPVSIQSVDSAPTVTWGSRRRAVLAAAAVIGAAALACVVAFVVNRGGAGPTDGKHADGTTRSREVEEGNRDQTASAGMDVQTKPLRAGDESMERHGNPRVTDTAQPSQTSKSRTMETESMKPEKILVRLSGLPRDAQVRLNGSPASSPLRLRADGKQHRLSVSALGYLAYTKEFTATANLRELEVRMKREEVLDAVPPGMVVEPRRTAVVMETPTPPPVPRVEAMRKPPDKTMSGTYANPFD
jgi:hypothetical protein